MIPEWMLLMDMTPEQRKAYEENSRILNSAWEMYQRRYGASQ